MVAVVGHDVASRSRDSRRGWHLHLATRSHVTGVHQGLHLKVKSRETGVHRGHVGHRLRLIGHASLDVLDHGVTLLEPDIAGHVRDRHTLPVTGRGRGPWRKSREPQHG